MKLINVQVIIIFFFLLIGFNGLAQKYDRILNINYNSGLPIGGLGNFIKNKNYDGLSFEGQYFITDKVSLGVATGWNSFKKKIDRQVYTFENGEISAVQTRYFRSIPLLLTGQYYFHTSEESKIRPYVALSIGVYNVRYEKWYGSYPYVKSSWTFGARPEAGVLIPFSEKVGLSFNIRYNIASYSFEEINNLNWVEAGLGLFLRFDSYYY